MSQQVASIDKARPQDMSISGQRSCTLLTRFETVLKQKRNVFMRALRSVSEKDGLSELIIANDGSF